MPKVGGRKLAKACKNQQNRALTLPKSIPKRSKTVFTRKVVFRTALGEQRPNFRKPFLRLGFQDGAELEAKTKPTSIKNRCKKRWNFEGFWKAIISKNLRFWRPTWRQVGTKIEAEIDVIFERRLFEKTLFFLRKNLLFWDPVGRSWEQKSIKNWC